MAIEDVFFQFLQVPIVVDESLCAEGEVLESLRVDAGFRMQHLNTPQDVQIPCDELPQLMVLRLYDDWPQMRSSLPWVCWLLWLWLLLLLLVL